MIFEVSLIKTFGLFSRILHIPKVGNTFFEHPVYFQ